MARNEDGIENILAPYIAAVSQHNRDERFIIEKKTLLEEQGIVFPSAEVEWLQFLRAAKAAKDRGSVVLANDGSIVDPGTFRYEDADAVFFAESNAIKNQEKLRVLAKLESIAFSSTLSVAFGKSEYGLKSDEVRTYTYIQEAYKHYVQLMLRIEAWEQPWLNIVDTEFGGSALGFPLTAEELEEVHNQFADPLLAGLHRYHSIGSYALNIFNRLDDSVGSKISGNYDESAEILRIASVSAIHYVHSPVAALKLLAAQVPESTHIDWQQEIIKAVESSREIFA